MVPSVRPELHDAYWRFAAERQRIFHSRVRGEPGPWTQDPILRNYRFCNAYRASDRVSQFLIASVIHDPKASALSPEDVFLRVVLFRLFSRETTWEALERETDGVRAATLHTQRLADVLEQLRRSQPIYTAAFILAAHDTYGHRVKHRNHLALVQDMFRPGRLGYQLAHAGSLREVYELLLEWPTIGPFMAYQLAIDLNYTEHLAFDEDDFTVPGPGARRGLQKVFRDDGGISPEQLIMRMVDSQEDEFDRLGLPFEDLFGRRLHAIDCQNLFCEVDKYARKAFPELRSNRTRIKRPFIPSLAPLHLFYPPKWGLNERLSRAGPLGTTA
jgi:hypothetical protein